MEQLILARGFCEFTIKDVMDKKLYCPTSVDSQLPLINPKLHFWSDPDSVNAAERYAVHIAEYQSKHPYVVTLTVNRQNFPLLVDKISQPGGTAPGEVNGRIIRLERPLKNFDQVITAKVTVAIDQLSDQDLIGLFCRIGTKENEVSFTYTYYQTLLESYGIKK